MLAAVTSVPRTMTSIMRNSAIAVTMVTRVMPVRAPRPWAARNQAGGSTPRSRMSNIAKPPPPVSSRTMQAAISRSISVDIYCCQAGAKSGSMMRSARSS